MRKTVSGFYRILTALLIFGLLLPTGFASAEDRTSGTLTIHKYEQEPGTEQGEPDGSSGQNPKGKPLPGVVYKVKQTHSYDGENWTEVSDGAEYTLTTNENGEVTQELPLGRYSVVETGGPDHVNLNPDTFYVDIPMTSKDGSTLNYDVHIYPKNETIRGAVELTKVDGDTNKALDGVVFELYHKDGTQVEGTFTTDADGKIRIDGLAYGDYFFKEVATKDGYVLGSQNVPFSIQNSGKFEEDGTTTGEIVEVNIDNYKSPEPKKEVDESDMNRGEEVTYTITNTLPGDIHKYKQFVITDVLDDRLSYVDGSWTVEGVDPSALTFEQNGQTLKWTVHNFAALEGVKEMKISFKAKIAEDAPPNEVINNKAIIDFENQHGNDGHKETDETPVNPTAGYLTVIKQDKSSQKRLAGAEFELRDLEGNVIKSGVTNDNGELSFKELDYGKYQLVETKAPEGYRKLTKPIDVTVDKSNHEQTITVDNSKTDWELPTTGGIGTTLFTLIGLALMVTAFVLYVRRRKSGAEVG
ncbi:fimbrial isopeptide formation D2 family protein/LPXTG-motif cell wall-anchored protein [Bacillus thermophilus]|uniref:Fimbrial isopeptide formation D2 family protein/LPXTG-motif cell wall-anchored protein n=1 Tax=Siminovitchia thermophila TaxID=1245522 RepID=A0ABS2R677_9BACI|nr:SpaH/EbpB family LPXTG-anchored major pilin [Siminovitchia thermophila]MBM7715162.1 fimbrial isopeptide formation D2 family protein/LPXTG-motif cell wall-anchored protein [Siminovitchia thermophila]ONK22765.1 hypothetical protein BLX87_13655 [Bacillus sp. VT-16-64]